MKTNLKELAVMYYKDQGGPDPEIFDIMFSQHKRYEEMVDLHNKESLDAEPGWATMESSVKKILDQIVRDVVRARALSFRKHRGKGLLLIGTPEAIANESMAFSPKRFNQIENAGICFLTKKENYVTAPIN